MKYRNIILTCIFILSSLFVSKTEAQKKVTYGGYFEIGGKEEYKDVYVESYYRAKLEFGMKLSDKTKVEVDIRADSENRQFQIYEVSATFKLTPSFKLEIGDLKKRYGLEEQVSHEKLFTVKESLINEYLEPMGYVNREPGVHLYWTDPDSKVQLAGGIHYNESHKLTIMSRVSKEGFLGVDKAGFNFQFSDETRVDMPDTYAISMDVSQNILSAKCDFEIFMGQDPVESYYRLISGGTEKVSFFGFRSIITKNYPVALEFLKSIEPVLQGSFLVKDVNLFDVNTVQILLGCNLYFEEDVRLMINGNLDLTNHSYDKNGRTLYGSGIIAQLQLRW
jgi:hypothetical protein